MQSLKDLVTVREVELNDLPFILDSAITCLSKYTESFIKGYTPEYARNYLEKIVLYILNNSNYSCFVCTHKNDTDSVISYCIANPHTNHIFFSYTKYAYRKLGIQKLMLLPLLVDFNSKLTVQWPTKEMLKLQRIGKIYIENKVFEEFLQ